MNLRPLAGCLALGLLLACGCRGCGPRPDNDPDADPDEDLLRLDSGLSDAQRQEFYHLTMGSELMPLAWLRALDSAATGKPFLEQVERFGLLPDAENPDHLPVGLTAAPSRDSRFGVRHVLPAFGGAGNVESPHSYTETSSPGIALAFRERNNGPPRRR